jgi:Cu(I)/Ag(I) efflux system membrane protein CusA/SilA
MDQWRPGMTPGKLVDELDRVVKGAGAVERLGAADPQPDRHARDRNQESVGVKVAGTNLSEIDRIAGEIERAVRPIPGVTSAFAERLTGGRYIDVHIDRDAAARYGLNIAGRARAWSRRRSAATTSARRSRDCSGFRSTSAIRARSGIRSSGSGSCRC